MNVFIGCDFDRPEAICSFQSIVILDENMTDGRTILKINKATLEQLYVYEKLSCDRIGKIYDCCGVSIFNRLKRFSIPTRPRKNEMITKEELEKLYATPMTHKDIAKIYGFSQSNISLYFKKFGIKSRHGDNCIHYIPKGFIKNPSMRYDNITHVNTSPSPELSYILGVYFGDATLDHKSRIIQLVVKDKDFCEEFVRCFSDISNKIYTVHPYGIYYRATPCSKQFYNFIVGKEVSDFSDIILKYPCDFIRGFFDSEGGVDIISKYGRRVRFSNTDITLLEYVQSLLLNIGISSKIYREKKIGEVIYGKNGKAYTKTKDTFRLTVPTQEAPIFAKLISSSIKRKRDKLEVQLCV